MPKDKIHAPQHRLINFTKACMRKTRTLRKLSGWRLLPTISIWVVLAIAAVVAVFLAVTWLFGGGECYPWSRPSEVCGDRSQAKALDSLKIALTVIGGIGAVPYLIIKYRERASVERDEAGAKLLAAVQQLGSESPQVRIAGVYALADVADKYQGDYKQRVVDVLCGYLRTERGEWQTILDRPDNAEHHKEQYSRRYVSKDGAVESTILELLAIRLCKQKETIGHWKKVRQKVADSKLWCDCDIDLHGAHLTERLDFYGITCKSLRLYDAILDQPAVFEFATFDTHVDCFNTKFVSESIFTNANFNDTASFREAEFCGPVSFMRAIFSGITSFSRSCFSDEANFASAAFEGEFRFKDTRGLENADFIHALFNVIFRKRDLAVFPDVDNKEKNEQLPSGSHWARFNHDTIEELKEDLTTQYITPRVR